MILQRHVHERGLWIGDTAGRAGAHALIIGISRYRHLIGGEKPALDTAGLGQLAVSAKTAARLFEWVSSEGALAGVPIATCRLMLAPAPDEAAEVDQITGGWYGTGDFRSLRDATEAWGNALIAANRLPGPNVAFFFFSGHGIEHLASPSMLASDVLALDVPNGGNNAVAFDPLWKAIRTFGVARALFLVDACRNAPDLARRLNIVGTEILSPRPYPDDPPEALVWLQATRMGSMAYQKKDAAATFFGQALLDALKGVPPDYLPYDTSGNPWLLTFSHLESHVKQKVRDLLREGNSTLTQPVEPGGYPYNGDALVAQRPPSPPSPADLPPPPVPGTGTVVEARAADILERFVPANLAAVRATATRGGQAWFGELASRDIMHEVFGRESITEPWTESLRILDVGTGSPVDGGSVTLSNGLSDARDEQATAWIDVLVEPGAGSAVWIEAGGGASGRRWAVTVPRDLRNAVPVRLDVVFRAPERKLGWKWDIESLSARVAPPPDSIPPGQREVWNALWNIQRVETLSDLASARADAQRSEPLLNALRGEIPSPVAAAVGYALLLRSGALGSVEDGPCDLADGAPWLPDGSVLWAETLLRRREGWLRAPAGDAAIPPWIERLHPPKEAPFDRWALKAAGLYFARIAGHGLPRLTPVLAMALRQADLLDRKALGKRHPHAKAIYDARKRLRKAAAYAVPGGLFATFTSTEGDFGPGTVLG